MKKLLVSAMIAAGTLGVVAAPLPSVAATNVDIFLNFAPPSPRYEVVPPPRGGYIWSPGYWGWDGYRRTHIWVAGHWERVRPGYTYYAPGWVQRDGRWHYRSSRWDWAGDGVANRRDPTPGGVGPRWDRDGDGIANRRDPTPDGIGPRWDRDNDGIPNHRDPTPDGRGRLRDTDRDGVPDRYDTRPNNAYRR